MVGRVASVNRHLLTGGFERGLLLYLSDETHDFECVLRHALKSELLPTHLAILLCRAGQGGSHAGSAQAGSRLKYAPDSLAEWSKALASGASP